MWVHVNFTMIIHTVSIWLTLSLAIWRLGKIEDILILWSLRDHDNREEKNVRNDPPPPLPLELQNNDTKIILTKMRQNKVPTYFITYEVMKYLLTSKVIGAHELS